MNILHYIKYDIIKKIFFVISLFEKLIIKISLLFIYLFKMKKKLFEKIINF